MGIELLPPPVPEQKDEVRELTSEEIQKYVKPGYDATGNPLPDPRYSTFVGAFRDGRVVASIGLQLKLHAQPLQIEDGHAAILPALIKGAEEVILSKAGPQWVYLFSPAGKLAQIAQTMGMQLESWVVMSKFVTPDIPQQSPIELSVPAVSEERIQ